MSIALLSDFHNNENAAAILRLVRREQPDLICIPGDVVYGEQPIENRSPLITQTNIRPFLEGCLDIAPTFVSLGNHEWALDDEDLAMIRDTGVVLLDNEYTVFTTGADRVVVGGLTSAYVTEYRKYRSSLGEIELRYPRKPERREAGGLTSSSDPLPDLDWLQSFVAEEGYKILLSHHPEYWPAIKQLMGNGIVVSGHAHGGQIRIFNPIKRGMVGLFAPGQGWWPRWTRGVYKSTTDENGGVALVVTAGLTNTAAIPRLFNPTEVVVVSPRCG